ncbi:MAG: sensor histidine kinase [Acidiferrobacter sp.]
MVFEEVPVGEREADDISQDSALLYEAQVRLLYENLPPGLLITAVNTAILAEIAWYSVSWVRVGVWLALMAIVTLGRYTLVSRYRMPGVPRDARLWGRYYAWATLAAGCAWGASAVFLFPAALLPQIFLFFMLTAMTTAAVVSFAAVFPVALLFVIPTLAPLALRLFFLGGDLHHAMGVVAILFLGVMLLTAKRMERTIAASLRLRFENQGLIAHLEKEKIAIERLNADLTREVAARIQMTEDLREREAYLRAVLENVDEGIVTIDQRGALQSLNREALRIFGYEEDELLGCHFSHLVPLGDRAEYVRFLEDRVERAGSRMSGLGLEVNGLRRDGTIFPMELGLSVMSLGADRRFVAITRDVTARKRTERLKSDLVATLSHELKTPLTSALGSLGLLMEVVAGKLTGDGERLLKIARSNLDRLARSVNEVLDVDQSQIAHMKWAPVPLVLMRLAEEAVAADADYAHDRHVRLALDPCSSSALICGDKPLLLRALSHIITNAIHLSPPHSTVELSVVDEGGQGVVSIRDCGAAIPVEARSCLFDAAVHLSAFGVVAPRGLYMARTIIEKHGGSVGYESREAGGSHFFFRLPLCVKDAD